MKYLIINGHPDLMSFTSQMARQIYLDYINDKKDISLLNLAELDFNPNFLGYGSLKEQPIENDLQKAQELIKSAKHLILITPIWWSTYPALLKGFFDKTLLPGFAFRFHENKAIQDKLLKGRTAELILLSDAPAWYRRLLLNDPASKILKRDILGFCGIKVVKTHRIGSVNKLTTTKRDSLIQNFSKALFAPVQRS